MEEAGKATPGPGLLSPLAPRPLPAGPLRCGWVLCPEETLCTLPGPLQVQPLHPTWAARTPIPATAGACRAGPYIMAVEMDMGDGGFLKV